MEKDGKSSSDEKSNNGDDKTLFRKAMWDVKPLTTADKIIHSRPKPQPFPRPQAPALPDIQDILSDSCLLEIAEDDEWSFARPGLQRHMLRKLRRGHWHIQAELDLHGFNRKAAHRALIAFLDNSIQRGCRCVRVIHGRGLSSRNRRPILKILIGNWLVQRHDVLAFCQARLEHGGSGAVLILLRNSQK